MHLQKCLTFGVHINSVGVNLFCSINWNLSITVQTAGNLTLEEEQDLKDWITGQNSDGLGEGFEQQEIHFDGGYRGGYMYVSFWNPGDDYFVDNETEFEERFNTQGMEMGGM